MSEWLLDVAGKIAAAVAVSALVWAWHVLRRFIRNVERAEHAAIELADVDRRILDIVRRLAYQVRVTREMFNFDTSGILQIERDIRPLRERYWEPDLDPTPRHRGDPAPQRVLNGD